MTRSRSTPPAWLLGAGLALALLTPAARANFDFDVTLTGTNNLAGTTYGAGSPYAVDFALTDGGPEAGNNTVTISNIQLGSGGSASGSASVLGGATGSLTTGVTLTDTGAINDFNQGFTPGDTLSFHVSMTTSPDTTAPDRFSFSVLDKTSKPIPTTDPTAGPQNSLLFVDITGPIPDTSHVFHTTGTAPTIGPPTVTVTPVPEPSSLALLALGLGGLAGSRLLRARTA